MAQERHGDFLIALAPSEERPRQGTYFDVVFTIVVWLTGLFSGYTTYLGFSVDIPKVLAAFFAVVIGLCLVAINFKLREARRKGLGLAGPLMALAVVFVVSFISNTNAIYSYFIARDIVSDTQEEAWRVFDSETSKILAAVSEVPAYAALEERKSRLEVVRQNLKTQIADSRNPGFGELAQAHYAEVMKILRTDLTPLRAPESTAPPEQLMAYANRLDEFIVEQAAIQFRSDPAAALDDYRANIQKVRAFYESKVRAKEYSSDTTDLMSRDLTGYAVKARALLPGVDLDLKEINNSADEIGAFQYTWRNFLNWINPVAIVLSVLLSALLDLLVPLLTLLLYRPEW
jgi:hypothetical protein